MLPVPDGRLGLAGEAVTALRFATPDSLDAYMNRVPHQVTPVSAEAALEESFFLGLRLNRGVDLQQLQREFGLWQGNDAPGEDDLQNREGHDFSRAINIARNPASAAEGATWIDAIEQCKQEALLEQHGVTLRLTPRGRLLSNEVFARFLAEKKIKVGTARV
jgi:oxygen-independent coproporphyrinogen-3 oxidase